ncbi:CLUMA_CG018355, isoform A [Clunio marinus]|uniref:CLUMA_CG018355, isoform A n=1 Tax=Clunio marinus TaxID=568069 RepID=A0A1J1J303_9DIPT|nr:CLUMA_CG018355, isoform A [Clunio marinus]
MFLILLTKISYQEFASFSSHDVQHVFTSLILISLSTHIHMANEGNRGKKVNYNDILLWLSYFCHLLQEQQRTLLFLNVCASLFLAKRVFMAKSKIAER